MNLTDLENNYKFRYKNKITKINYFKYRKKKLYQYYLIIIVYNEHRFLFFLFLVD